MRGWRPCSSWCEALVVGFVVAFVAVVASRVSARRPSYLLCIAKEGNPRSRSGTVLTSRSEVVHRPKATPLSASPARLSALRGNLRCSRRAGKRSNSALRASDSRASCWCSHNFAAQSERTPADASRPPLRSSARPQGLWGQHGLWPCPCCLGVGALSFLLSAMRWHAHISWVPAFAGMTDRKRIADVAAIPALASHASFPRRRESSPQQSAASRWLVADPREGGGMAHRGPRPCECAEERRGRRHRGRLWPLHNFAARSEQSPTA